ncbi:MAG: hypothetical protein AAGF71_01885 [Pseudomonadota bacterium]
MDRNEFIIAVMVLLFGSFLLGFLTHWVVTRLSRVSDAEIGQLDAMAEDLHRAEDERDAAKEARHRLELQARTEIADLKSELTATREALDSALAEGEELREFIQTENMSPMTKGTLG